MTVGSFSRKCFFDMLLIFINISNKQHQRFTVNSLVCFVRSIQPVTGPYKKGERVRVVRITWEDPKVVFSQSWPSWRQNLCILLPILPQETCAQVLLIGLCTTFNCSGGWVFPCAVKRTHFAMKRSSFAPRMRGLRSWLHSENSAAM